MPTKVLMIGFNSYGKDSDIPALVSASQNFRVLSALLTHERAGAQAASEEDIETYLNISAKTAREKIENTIDQCKASNQHLLVYITGHGLTANKSIGGEVVDAFVVPTMNATKETAKEGRSDYCLDIETDLFSYLRKIDSPYATVVLDCCNANAAIRGRDEVTNADDLSLEPAGLGLQSKSGRNFAVITASGSGQSAWETNWADVSPCRLGLKKTYEQLEITSDIKVTNFIGALVDVWGLSSTILPQEFDYHDLEDDTGEVFHFIAAANLNEKLNETPNGLVSFSDGVLCVADLLEIMEDARIRQKVGISDPKQISGKMHIFRLPGPSRHEKLEHLCKYISDLTEVTEVTRQRLLKFVDRGLSEKSRRPELLPKSLIELEDRLYQASINKSGAEFVEEFLLDGISERVRREVAVRSEKWNSIKMISLEMRRELRKKTSSVRRLRVYTATFLSYSAVVTAVLFFVLFGGYMR